eukprot:COSAG02_NODE_19308_length_889_cov_1.141772_2_plen_88_part_00
MPHHPHYHHLPPTRYSITSSRPAVKGGILLIRPRQHSQRVGSGALATTMTTMRPLHVTHHLTRAHVTALLLRATLRVRGLLFHGAGV